MNTKQTSAGQRDGGSGGSAESGSGGSPPSVQAQGGILHARASSAKQAGASGDTGWIRGAVDVPGPSLDNGGGAQPHDGRAHHGLTGDDGAHQATDSAAVPAPTSGGEAADLGRSEAPHHRSSDDPAERTSGGDRPNDGGRMTGAAGGPADTVATDLPGDDDTLAGDNESASHGGSDAQASHGGSDAQRDQQI